MVVVLCRSGSASYGWRPISEYCSFRLLFFGSGRWSETGSRESQAGLELLDLELLILLSPAECWDHRYMLPHLVLCSVSHEIRAL